MIYTVTHIPPVERVSGTYTSQPISHKENTGSPDMRHHIPLQPSHILPMLLTLTGNPNHPVIRTRDQCLAVLGFLIAPYQQLEWPPTNSKLYT